MGVKDMSGAFHSSEHTCGREIIAPAAETQKFSSNVECQTTRPHKIKKKSFEARTGVDAGFHGTIAGAERKRFDEATMLSSKMIIEDNSTQPKFAKNFQRTATFSEHSIIVPPLYIVCSMYRTYYVLQ